VAPLEAFQERDTLDDVLLVTFNPVGVIGGVPPATVVVPDTAAESGLVPKLLVACTV
jgi:hypothetical protein